MCDRFYTAENVLDLVQRVFNVVVVGHKDKTEWISNVAFPVKNGMFTMANSGKGKDHYDGLYMLLYQIAKFKDEGKMPERVMLMREGESHPMDVAIELLEEKRRIKESGIND